MRKKRLFNCVGMAFAAVLACSCATRATLHGGPKDTEPPQCVKSEPANRTVRVDKPQIRLSFNEYFSLQSPSDSIRITPAQTHAPQYAVKGKTLCITLKDSLLPHTTYHVDVGGSVIKDITEGNAAPAFSFVFSTGDALDSGFLCGEVLDSYTLLPVAQACVLLYVSEDDSCPLRDAPDFFTLTDRQGKFRFGHIPVGEYRLYALGDKNFNRRFDQTDERFAFIPENRKVSARALSATDTLALEEHRLLLFQERPEKLQFLQHTSDAPGVHTFVFNLPAEKVRLQALGTETPAFVTEYAAGKDTLRFYCCDTSRKERTDFLLLYGEEGRDTVTFIPYAAETVKTQDGAAAATPLKYQAPMQVEIHENFRVTFAYPLQSVDTSVFQLFQVHQKTKDTQEVRPILLRTDTLRPRELVLDYPLSARYDYTLRIPDSACIACNGLTNDSLSLDFHMKGKKEYGGLRLHLRLPERHPYMIQLVRAKGQTVCTQALALDAQTADTATVFFPYVEEGEYCVRVIGDSNGNAQWDSGKYLLRRQAESVFYAPEPLTVRKRWITEETIEVLFK